MGRARASEVLKFLKDFQNEHSRMPSRKEACYYIKIFPGAFDRIIKKLVDDGKLERATNGMAYRMIEMKYFVWIDGVAGPEPQLWADMQVDGSGKNKPYLACHAIAGDDRRSLKQLEQDFKYEQHTQQ